MTDGNPWSAKLHSWKSEAKEPKPIGIFLDAQWLLTPLSDLVEIHTNKSFNGNPGYLQE